MTEADLATRSTKPCYRLSSPRWLVQECDRLECRLGAGSGLVSRLREERRQDLLHLLAPAMGALRTAPAMLRKWLGAIEDMVAVATAVLIGRHGALHSDLGAGELPDRL
jgi:hypothetical protein